MFVESNMHNLNSGFMVSGNRKAKAEKIIKIISEAYSASNSQGYRYNLLDIGTGNGEIAHYLGDIYEVTSIDTIDQRQIKDGYKFSRIEGERLPFPDQSFDIVVSNHVIEHVISADKHLAEIARIIKNDGLVYLATPNRLWPWEVHYRIPLLHYLPAHVFMSLMKKLNRYHEDIYLLGWGTLKQKTKQYFTLSSFSARICKWPKRYHIECSPKIANLLGSIPLWFYQIFTFINPTLVVILHRKTQNNENQFKLFFKN